jgi:hypothetical protein
MIPLPGMEPQNEMTITTKDTKITKDCQTSFPQTNAGMTILRLPS